MISIFSLEKTEKTNSNGFKSKVHPKLQGILKTGYLNCYIQDNFEHLSCFTKWFHCRLYKTNKNVKFDDGVPGNLVRVRVPPKQFSKLTKWNIHNLSHFKQFTSSFSEYLHFYQFAYKMKQYIKIWVAWLGKLI